MTVLAEKNWTLRVDNRISVLIGIVHMQKKRRKR